MKRSLANSWICYHNDNAHDRSQGYSISLLLLLAIVSWTEEERQTGLLPGVAEMEVVRSDHSLSIGQRPLSAYGEMVVVLMVADRREIRFNFP